MNPDESKVLDEEGLKSLIEALQAARHFGFASSSSPVEYLLEAGVDLLLTLSSLFKDGRPARRVNPELQFSDKEVDSLNNPKQIRLVKKQPIWQDELLAEKFKQVASFLIQVKQRDPRARSFAEQPETPVSQNPPTGGLGQEVLKISSTLTKLAVDAYHRRQRKRRRSEPSQSN